MVGRPLTSLLLTVLTLRCVTAVSVHFDVHGWLECSRPFYHEAMLFASDPWEWSVEPYLVIRHNCSGTFKCICQPYEFTTSAPKESLQINLEDPKMERKVIQECAGKCVDMEFVRQNNHPQMFPR